MNALTTYSYMIFSTSYNSTIYYKKYVHGLLFKLEEDSLSSVIKVDWYA